MGRRYSPILSVLYFYSPRRLTITHFFTVTCTVQYFPSWLPGIGFKRLAKIWKSTILDFNDRPYAFVKHQMVRALLKGTFVVHSNDSYLRSFKAAGLDNSSFTSYNIEKGLADTKADEEILKNASAQLFAAGADTVGTL